MFCLSQLLVKPIGQRGLERLDFIGIDYITGTCTKKIGIFGS